MKVWVENRPGRPGGSDFKTDDIGDCSPPSEEDQAKVRSLIKRMASDENDATLLLDALGLRCAAQ